MKVVMTEEQKREFIALYPTTSNDELAARYGSNAAAIKRRAQVYGITKDAEHIKRMLFERTMDGLSDGYRQRRREIATGRVVSEESKRKRLETIRAKGGFRRGADAPNWKGGNPWKRYEDPAYIAWRATVLERDNYTCQKCGRKCKKYERGLAAHHIKPYATHPDLRLNVSNGLTLCKGCHLALHGKAPHPKDLIPCACGCGTMIEPFNRYGRPKRYVSPAHAGARYFRSEECKAAVKAKRDPYAVSTATRAKMSASAKKRVERQRLERIAHGAPRTPSKVTPSESE